MGTTQQVTWIVCRGRSRRVSSGLVVCEMNRLMPIERCIDCHLLETLEGERGAAMSCSVTDAGLEGHDVAVGALQPPTAR